MYDCIGNKEPPMSVCITLPPDLETSLRNQSVDLDTTAKEAFLVELYRQERITHHELASALDLSRLETDELLGRYNVWDDLPSLEELRLQAVELEAKLSR
jgi:hypothetical protein